MTKRSLAAVAALALLAFDVLPAPISFRLVSPAEARIGQPWSAASGAGVARRTTRRAIRHTTTIVPALPRGCVRATVAGLIVWRCGGVYYRASGGRYVVVRID